MSKPVVLVQVRAVAAMSGGCAVFLGNDDKVFVMFVDEGVGAAIAMFMQDTQKELPLPIICWHTYYERSERRSIGWSSTT